MNIRVAALVVVMTALATSASAQSLTLSPSVLELAGRPGQTTTQTLTLTNSTSIPLSFEILVQDVIIRDAARALVNAGEVAGSIAATAVFSPKRLIVEPGLKQSVTVTVTLPAATPIRAVVVMFKGTTEITDGVRTATASLGTLMTFAMSTDFSLAPSQLVIVPQSATTNAAFEQTFENDGTEPLVPKGIAVILDAAGTLVGKAPFEPQRLLPGERLTLRGDYPGSLPAGTYRILATFAFEGQSLTQTGTLVVQ